MKQLERLSKIKKILASQKHLKTREIAKIFNISFDTARRDILHLTTTGQALRVHGGIVAVNSNQIPSYNARTHILSPVKLKMAQAASKFFLPGKFYFFAPSTTIMQLCNQIHGINASVLTNSLDNAIVLMSDQLPEVNILGGKIQYTNRFISSPHSLEEINNFHFDCAFIGTAKVDKNGFYVANQADAAISHRILELSNQVILFAEKYKFTTTNSAPFKIGNLDQIDILITDSPLEQEQRSWFKSKSRVIHTMEEPK